MVCFYSGGRKRLGGKTETNRLVSGGSRSAISLYASNCCMVLSSVEEHPCLPQKRFTSSLVVHPHSHPHTLVSLLVLVSLSLLSYSSLNDSDTFPRGGRNLSESLPLFFLIFFFFFLRLPGTVGKLITKVPVPQLFWTLEKKKFKKLDALQLSNWHLSGVLNGLYK